MSKAELTKKLQEIVESIETIEPVAVAKFDSDQWRRGEAHIKRIDEKLSSLNIDIKSDRYGVGIDGKNKGDILTYVKKVDKGDSELNNKNSQDERYKVPPEKIEEVVRYYAGVKKENMEQEFKKWLEQQKTQRSNPFKKPRINGYCTDLRETIPNWAQVDHPNLFTITDINIIKELYQRCKRQGDLYELSLSVSVRCRPRAALGKYKEFLESLEFIELPNQEDENVDAKLKQAISVLTTKKQIILQGSPGTGKTRLAKQIAEKLAPDNYKLIQFHPAYSYEDFVRGIVATTADGVVGYEVQNKVLAEMAENAINNPDDEFVLIIDEINRANLSSVLGELIYALEYRGEAVESMYEYQASRAIILPENLYIIGTMNTADRSVGHIDYAIRRRFAFVSVDTDESVIPNNAKPLFDKVKALFKAHLSEEFELTDVMIGHSYFLKNDLALALEYEIKPILQEYRKDGVLTCEKSDIDKLSVIDNLDVD